MLASSSQRNSGFSLLESLVAFMVLTLVLVASFEVFGSGTRNLNAATEAIGSVEKLQNNLSMLQAGLPISALDDDIKVQIFALQSEAMEWTDQLPYHVVLTHSEGKAQKRIDSIILGRKTGQP
jgi:type II secretory pathway pseudopilin PulG